LSQITHVDPFFESTRFVTERTRSVIHEINIIKKIYDYTMKSGSRSRHLSIVFHILHHHVSIIARGPHRENCRSSQVGFNARFIRQSPCILDDIFCIYVTIRLMHAPNSNYRTALTSIRTVITSSNNTCCVENFSPWNLYPTRRWWSS
jgi:hypothetical protein